MSQVFSDAQDPILVSVFSIIPSPSQLYVRKRDHGKSPYEVDEVLGTVVPSIMKDAIRE